MYNSLDFSDMKYMKVCIYFDVLFEISVQIIVG